MFYANGWAQAQAQGNLLLHLYGESRGRGADRESEGMAVRQRSVLRAQGAVKRILKSHLR